MSDESMFRVSRFGTALRSVAIAGTLALALTGGIGTAFAQDEVATEEEAIECALPAAAEVAPAAEASPAAEAVDEEADLTEVTDAAEVGMVETAVQNYFACLNAARESGDFGPAAALLTGRHIAEHGDVAGAAAAIAGPWEYSAIKVEDVKMHPDGGYTANITGVINGVQYFDEDVHLERSADGEWLLVDEEVINVPRPEVDTKVVVGANITEDEANGAPLAVELGNAAPKVGPTDALVLHVANASASHPVMVWVVSLDAAGGASLNDDGTVSVNMNTTPLAYSEVLQSGETEDVALINLAPGNYAVVAVEADGDISASNFMVVTPPAQ